MNRIVGKKYREPYRFIFSQKSNYKRKHFQQSKSKAIHCLGNLCNYRGGFRIFVRGWCTTKKRLQPCLIFCFVVVVVAEYYLFLIDSCRSSHRRGEDVHPSTLPQHPIEKRQLLTGSCSFNFLSVNSSNT